MFRSWYHGVTLRRTPTSNIQHHGSNFFRVSQSQKKHFFSLKNNKSKYWLSKVIHAEVSRDSLVTFCFFPLFCFFILFLFLLLWLWHFSISHSHGWLRTGSFWNVLVTHWNLFLPQSEAVFTRSESANSLSSGRVRSLTNATIATVVSHYEQC